jgi:hypothetical protein
MLIQVGPRSLQSEESFVFFASKAGVLTGTDTQRVALAYSELLAMDFRKPVHFRFKALADWTAHE